MTMYFTPKENETNSSSGKKEDRNLWKQTPRRIVCKKIDQWYID